eukprot:CAMPEP_0194549434 /NCGR_PEP_ID=MMETSP0253-20130528/95203_1 /TAXON_ID=2966 /ORGANISM="Noctiluca scintillans" /LENGTH=665 /DNA_ID=CAMNT_0039396863 /DNA_START=225 /DNA_END=2222 /DNA_ORIENTATION=-
MPTVQDMDGEVRELVRPWTLWWTKSPAYWKYDLTYIQDVAYDPVELVYQMGTDDCEENGPAEYCDQPLGTEAPASGFCCTCVDENECHRGGLVRGWGSSAHCLQFGFVTYGVYEIGPASTGYTVVVKIEKPAMDSSGNSIDFDNTEETLVEVNAQRPLAHAENGQLLVEIVGDLITTQAPENYQERYLVTLENIPDMILFGDVPMFSQDFMDYALIFDKDLFDLTGMTCEKIGIHWKGFYNQPARCQRDEGTCLTNQIIDKKREDDERKERGEQTLWYARSYCGGSMSGLLGNSSLDSTQKMLICPISSRQTTLMRIETSMEKFQFVQHIATGEIVSVETDSVQALTLGATVRVSMRNTGPVVALFTGGLDNCGPGLDHDTARVSSVEPNDTITWTFGIWTTGKSVEIPSCTATLWDARGVLLSGHDFGLNVTDLGRDSGSQHLDWNVTWDTGPAAECSGTCPSLFNIFCFVMHGCFGRLFAWLLFILSLIGVGVILYVAIQSGCLPVACSYIPQLCLGLLEWRARAGRKPRMQHAPHGVRGVAGMSGGLREYGVLGAEMRFPDKYSMHVGLGLGANWVSKSGAETGRMKSSMPNMTGMPSRKGMPNMKGVPKMTGMSTWKGGHGHTTGSAQGMKHVPSGKGGHGFTTGSARSPNYFPAGGFSSP